LFYRGAKKFKSWVKIIYWHFTFSKPDFKGKSLVIVPHEGLGDIIAIIAALSELQKHGPLSIVCDGNKWNQIIEAFEDVPKVEIRHFEGDKSYTSPVYVSSKTEELIALGYYSNTPIYKYPQSFYKQMGLPVVLCRKRLKLKPVSINNFDIPNKYLFIDNSTSVDNVEIHTNSDLPVVEVLSNTTLRVTEDGKERSIQLTASRCFAEKIKIAINADKIVCSDAALFNALVRIDHHVPITVKTRYHFHSHDKFLYRNCSFDGSLHELNANSK